MNAPSEITPDLFRQVGEICFGPNWQHAMAVALDTSPRRIRYMLAGRYLDHPTLPMQLHAVMTAASDNILYWRDRLFP